MSKRIDEYIEESPTQGASAIGLNASGDTRRLSLGTAANADVTTSATDTTAGRVTRVGDFGLGTDVTTDLGTITDITNLSSKIDEDVWSQAGRLTFSGVSGIPDKKYAVVVWPRSQRGTVFFHSNGDADIYYTARRAAGWQPVRKILHSVEFPSDTAWTQITSLLNDWENQSAPNESRYIRRAGMVTLTLRVNASGKSADQLFEMPSGYRPAVTLYFGEVVDTAGNTGRCTISSTGAVSIFGLTSSDIRGTFTYPVIT